MRERLALSRPKEAASGGKTGTWRTFRPVVDKETCNACGLCAQYCPDGGVIDEELNIDLDYCKGGCGICANECPKGGAIAMVREER
ncbi:4Fe-4S binding protein [Methanoculleus chikugoensis]|uniref:4Fe-4S binding protein n=1 Tax=Methanoculleus chikugoensis TaxID=118126 RepID=UPI0006CFD0CF|nr:4Fe-4S binding protein [Methanoculleus chikugoensis]